MKNQISLILILTFLITVMGLFANASEFKPGAIGCMISTEGADSFNYLPDAHKVLIEINAGQPLKVHLTTNDSKILATSAFKFDKFDDQNRRVFKADGLTTLVISTRPNSNIVSALHIFGSSAANPFSRNPKLPVVVIRAKNCIQ
jgi:hypothetical protein